MRPLIAESVSIHAQYLLTHDVNTIEILQDQFCDGRMHQVPCNDHSVHVMSPELVEASLDEGGKHEKDKHCDQKEEWEYRHHDLFLEIH